MRSLLPNHSFEDYSKTGNNRSSMQDLLESFAEPIPDFPAAIYAHLPPPPPALLAGYLDPRAFRGLDSGYGMIPYPAHFPHLDHYSTSMAAGVAVNDKANGSSDRSGIPPSSSSKGPSTAAKERRRERNKVLARKTRLKKKAETETLRDQLVALMVENEKLKNLVYNHIPPVSSSELLKSDMQLPENILKMVQQIITNEVKTGWSQLTLKQRSFIVVNPNANDYPIVYVSPGFLKLTGYTREECIGRNCRFLQGPDTDLEEASQFKEALIREEDVSVVLLNYHKDGTPFWNRIEVQHLRDETGKARFIVGVQTKCDHLSVRARLARQRDAYNLRVRKASKNSTNKSRQETADEMEEEEESYSGDNMTDTTKQTASTGMHNKAVSSSSLDSKVSKALDDSRDYHVDKRIRLSMKLESDERRQHINLNTDSPSTDNSQKIGDNNSCADMDGSNKGIPSSVPQVSFEKEQISTGDGSTTSDEGYDNPS